MSDFKVGDVVRFKGKGKADWRVVDVRELGAICIGSMVVQSHALESLELCPDRFELVQRAEVA